MYQGIHSNHAPKAIGPYSPAVKLGDFVYLSGQLPIDPLTDQLVSGDIYEQTYQVLRNMEAVLQEMGLELRHVVKTTVYVTDLKDFSKFNEIYATVFQDPYPARTTVQVAALPLGAMVEVEALVIDTLAYEAQMHHHHDHEGCGCGHDHDHEHEHNHEDSDCCGQHKHDKEGSDCCGQHKQNHEGNDCCGQHKQNHEGSDCCGQHKHNQEGSDCCGQHKHGHEHNHETCDCGNPIEDCECKKACEDDCGCNDK